MAVKIENTKYQDIPAVFALYDDAIKYQKEVGNNVWLGFEEELVKKEIDENRHYIILLEERIAGAFVVTFRDELIWKFSQDEPAIYLHRIATAQYARGNDLLKHIINWAKNYVANNQLSFIRMDTGSGNERLINYYIRCGFSVKNTSTTVNYTPDLPAHYKDGVFTLLQMPVEGAPSIN
ncbi:acetyltransferase (GNAT) family protein [Mucilaginibacter gracilis]|uniref:Acetyltransferase (GNAT) family protein n=1 Tax=Mucilaginibacter gracilis TaxID=423350 RepID=A0A495IVJ2_9SPHI|nr:GNAT family N-acetyltransferase [Mucilaginibacter gracilis]RKR80740.1 acetyltransferase (GNAT) family protein [Mucilaginibacter gracilis]